MARGKAVPKVHDYYQAVQEIFAKQAEILTAVLPHFGERGRNDEERIRDLFARVLPRSLSLGTGFVVCSDASVPPSAQIDIVIYDEHWNSPLHKELSAYIYPIETVYAAVEVKGRLRSSDLAPVFQNIARLRRLARQKHYVEFSSAANKPSTPNQLVVAPKEVRSTLAPRTYIAAYDTASWRSPTKLREALVRALSKNPKAHLHGLLLLKQGWFFYQEAYEEPPSVRLYADDALLRFVHKLTYDCLSVPMKPMSLDRYFKTSYGAG